jgi:hypothetical protein
MLSKERGEEITDEEAQRRAVAKLHRPKLRPLDNSGRYADPNDPRRYGTEVTLNNGSVALQNCWTMEPNAVHAKRNYDKITTEATRVVAEGKVQPEEIRFMCSEFFIWVRNGEHFLVRFGERRIPYRIDKNKLRVCYKDGTVTPEGYPPISVKSVGVFAPPSIALPRSVVCPQPRRYVCRHPKTAPARPNHPVLRPMNKPPCPLILARGPCSDLPLATTTALAAEIAPDERQFYLTERVRGMPMDGPSVRP